MLKTPTQLNGLFKPEQKPTQTKLDEQQREKELRRKIQLAHNMGCEHAEKDYTQQLIKLKSTQAKDNTDPVEICVNQKKIMFNYKGKLVSANDLIDPSMSLQEIDPESREVIEHERSLRNPRPSCAIL